MKKVMIYGMGISGTGAKALLETEGYEVILVDDKKAMTSEEAMQHLDNIEFFIKSPGIPYNDFVKEVQKRGIKVLDEIEVAYNYMIEKNLKTKIIAITGTNGKSTTTAKISDLLNYAGYKACYAGNIGRSLSEALLHEKDLDFVSLELSSFQLENVENFRPYISMIINMGPDHIERYKSFDEYYDTKFNIAKNQDENQYFIENIDDVEIEKRAKQIKAKRISVSKSKEANVYVEDNKIYVGKDFIIEADKLSLKGIHNLENTLFMVATAEILKIDKEKLKEFLIENTKGKAQKPGNIIDKNGKILGKHKGFSFYTIGQRKGLGISSEEPLYVLAFDKDNNNIIVGENEDLFKDELVATRLNLFSVPSLESLDNLECFAKTRSRDILHKCVLKKNGDNFQVKFIDNKVRAITPGQGIVFYNNDGNVIAGGFIES